MKHLTLVALALVAACSQGEETVAASENEAPPKESESAKPGETRAKGLEPVFSSAKVAKVKADIMTLDTAVTNYQLRNGRAPDSLELLVEPDENGHQFLNRAGLPKDPWGNDYLYEPPVGQDEHLILSYGADGQPGGEGAATDISNWTMRDE